MKILSNQRCIQFLCGILILLTFSCQRDLDELQVATYTKTAEVFIDDFSSGLNYASFGDGANPKAFQVDISVKYAGTKSMRFDVPDSNSSEGSFAGGSFFTSVGRDLSDYNALTFWIKATQSASVDVLGFGNDFGQNKYEASLKNVAVSTTWKKVIIPIPDPSKLTQERGMFFYSDGHDNKKGYSFWIDEVKFEKLGTITQTSSSVLNGEQKKATVFSGSTGGNNTINNLSAIFSLPTGARQTMTLAPSYFNFYSTNTNVATVDNLGKITILTASAGTATLGGILGSDTSSGNLIVGISDFTHAPTPTVDSSKVISIFSDAYTNSKVDYFNGYWAPYQTTQSADFKVGTDNVLNYTNFNFVGIEMKSPTIDASATAVLHVDVYLPDALQTGASFKVKVVDFGANGTFDDGGDDKSGTATFTAPTLKSKSWIRLDIPFSSLTGLTTRQHIAQIVFEGTNVSNFYADNIYFYNDGSIVPAPSIVPTVAAPVPTRSSADVLSIFSNTYTNVAGTDFNPDWGQPGFATAGQIPIGGNNTLAYPNFKYQGIQIGSAQDVSAYGFLHLDYYSANASTLSVFLISLNPTKESAFVLNVPTTGWNSAEIPLSAFAGVDLTKVLQFKFDGGDGTKNIYVDNIYFYKNPAPSIVPTVAAPVPTKPSADVLSIFSDTYTNVAGTDFNPNWGQAGLNTGGQIAIGGNNTLAYPNFNYQGIQIGSSQDVSAYGFLHLDYYSADASALRVFLISPPNETAFVLNVPTTGWNSAEIPLSAFAGVDLTKVLQFKFDGGDATKNVYVDNIYFYKGSGGGSSCPTPPTGEFIVDGGFEANAGCWELFNAQAGTSTTIVTNVNNGGTNAARIKTAQGGNPGIKQTRFGKGVILPNTTYIVKFDVRADASDPVSDGSVLNAFTFSERVDGSPDPATQHVLVQNDANVPTTWTTRTYTFTTASNVEGGLSLLIQLVGGGSTTKGTIFIDNVSLKKQ